MGFGLWGFEAGEGEEAVGGEAGGAVVVVFEEGGEFVVGVTGGGEGFYLELEGLEFFAEEEGARGLGVVEELFEVFFGAVEVFAEGVEVGGAVGDGVEVEEARVN